MKRFQLTQNQRRFLIFWITFHSFALLVNIANFQGKVYEGDISTANIDTQAHKKIDTPNIHATIPATKKIKKIKSINDMFKLKPGDTGEVDTTSALALHTRWGYAYSNNNHLTVCLFTTYKSDDFWPFTTYYDEEHPTSFDVHTTHCHFYGIFNSYSFRAYIFYMFIGFAFVFIPKFWKKD